MTGESQVDRQVEKQAEEQVKPAAAGKGTGAEAPPPGGRLFRYRNAMGIGLVVLLAACPWGRLPLGPALLAPGLALVLLGVSLRLWCILQIGGSARKTSRLKAERVISWGPYSMVRNPIYIANTTTFAGFTVLAGLPWLLPLVFIALGLWYDAIVRREERFLETTHPEAFAEYRRLAGRWLPRLRYRGRPPGVLPYPFLRALKRERGHLIAVGAGLAAVLLLRLLG
ncbi:MAG: isoprenylcysteine carboxylmethyltransferase family protein [Planctomycetes bacterium]|nr:isoprenylcysteine carboxylmethyltransferase family protein [Planctomycetota bacterium]